MSEPLNRWDPRLYNERAAFVTAAGHELVELCDPRPGERVLDLGCGTGELTAMLASRGAIVTGLDASGASTTSENAPPPSTILCAIPADASTSAQSPASVGLAVARSTRSVPGAGSSMAPV